jgi:hypothetical protein
MRSQLPTLTDDGILEDDRLKSVKLFEYFLVSEYSQSTIFFGDISSLKYLIAEYSDDYSTLTNEIQNTLTKLYNRYFDHSDVTCVLKNQDDQTNAFDLFIEIEITNDNKKFKLSKTVSVVDNAIDILKTIEYSLK